MARRTWTRIATMGAGAHVFYELASGVGMPLASRIGPVAAAALFGLGSGAAFREAGRQPPARDPAFSMLNGFYLSAVLAHFAGWPHRWSAGLPWLTECEGLTGAVLRPYNVILQVSGVAAVGGLLENSHVRRRWGVVVPLVLIPVLISEQHREYGRLLVQAQRRPGWWNRRLRSTSSHEEGPRMSSSSRNAVRFSPPVAGAIR